MGVVMIACPNSDRAFSTGIECDPRTFATFQMFSRARNVPIVGLSTSGGRVRLGLRRTAALTPQPQLLSTDQLGKPVKTARFSSS